MKLNTNLTEIKVGLYSSIQIIDIEQCCFPRIKLTNKRNKTIVLIVSSLLFLFSCVEVTVTLSLQLKICRFGLAKHSEPRYKRTPAIG